MFAVGTGPRRATPGWAGREGSSRALQNTASVFTYGCVKVAVCVNGSCDEGSAYRIFQREKEKSFSRDEILGSLEAQRTVGALFPPSALKPTSPSCSPFPIPFTSSFHVPSLFISVINFVYLMQADVHAPKKETTEQLSLLCSLAVCVFLCIVTFSSRAAFIGGIYGGNGDSRILCADPQRLEW